MKAATLQKIGLAKVFLYKTGRDYALSPFLEKNHFLGKEMRTPSSGFCFKAVTRPSHIDGLQIV